MGSFAPKGHAKLNPASPAAFAICEKCGFMYNHRDLRWDMQYRGKYLQKTGFLVCDSCFDVPNPTLRPIVLPADPVPIMNPRAEPLHCHVFRPRADLLTRPYPTADTASRIYPPIDDITPEPVTVDTGDICDARTYKDGWSVPVPPGPIPQPPIEPPDATGDNAQATADTTTTTVDAGPVYVYDFTTDTTLILADALSPTVDAFPIASPPPEADTTWRSADDMIWTADASPDPWLYTDGNTADTIKKVADDGMSPEVNVNAYPDYLYAADVPTVNADISTVRSDNIT